MRAVEDGKRVPVEHGKIVPRSLLTTNGKLCVIIRKVPSGHGVKTKNPRRTAMDMEISFPGGKKVDAIYKGFTIKTDQPERSGGEGLAPAPFDLFLASIGTCAGIYVLSFCQARNIPTEGIRLIQCTESNPETKMIDRITIKIQLPPGFPEKYGEALVKSAEFCAVKKHIHNPPAFDIYTTRPEGG